MLSLVNTQLLRLEVLIQAMGTSARKGMVILVMTMLIQRMTMMLMASSRTAVPLRVLKDWMMERYAI